jgi:2-C-methyl-D-erythritol 4-phosphate cytidylyltransferase
VLVNTTAIIVAAGTGSRMGGAVSKTYLPIAGRALVLRTLDQFFACQSVEKVVLVVAGNDVRRCEALLKADSALGRRPWVLQVGGASRQESVYRGLQTLDPDCQIVLIHDGARPFVSPALIDRCVATAGTRQAVVVGVPVRETIKVVSENRQIISTPARNSLWEIQTPQVFQRRLIVEAYEWAERQGIRGTDDATLVEEMGRPVFVLDGEPTNIKITIPEDLIFAEALARRRRVP